MLGAGDLVMAANPDSSTPSSSSSTRWTSPVFRRPRGPRRLEHAADPGVSVGEGDGRSAVNMTQSAARTNGGMGSEAGRASRLVKALDQTKRGTDAK